MLDDPVSTAAELRRWYASWSGAIRRIGSLVAVGILVASVACGDAASRSAPSDSRSLAPRRVLEGIPPRVTSALGVPDGWVLTRSDLYDGMLHVDADGQEVTTWRMPSPTCAEGGEYVSLSPTIDGGAMIQLCPNDAVGLQDASILTFTLGDRTPRELVPGLVERRILGGPAVDPDGNRAIVPDGDLCATLYVADASGFRPWDIEVQSGDRSWRLDDVPDDTSRGCPEQGVADYPTWHGGSIAFLASLEVIGRNDQDRIGAAWELYVASFDDDRARPIADSHVVAPSDLEWSPQGDRLALAVAAGDSAGVWLIDPASERWLQVSEEPAQKLAWSMDAQKLLVLEPLSDTSLDVRAVVLDLADAVDGG
jgi:hypothetical protein